MTAQALRQDASHSVNLHEEHTEITIDALGRVNIEGKNYMGDACSILGDKLRNAFGGGGDKEDKPEAFAAATDTVNSTNW